MIDMFFGQVLGAALHNVQVQDPLLRELRSWFAALLQTAPGRWRAVLQNQIPCSAHTNCERFAVGACFACKKPACLGHGLISAHAEILCFQCAHAVAQKYGRTPPSPPPFGHERQQGTRADPEETLKQHLKVLGLKSSASLDVVRAKFKKLAVKYHPDKFATSDATKRAEAAEKFAKITASYHWLIEHMTQKAAA